MRPALIRFCALFWILVGVGLRSEAQICPEPGVNESLYGTNTWNGYVYDGLNTFNTDNFIGTLNQSTEFNANFAAGQTDGGCPFDPETFSVRFKNRQSFACGLYTFTVTSNNVARLSLDGGNTFLINVSAGTGNASVHLTGGTYDLVLEYVHNTGSPQVSFDFDDDPGDHPGVVSGDQVICDNPADPAEFASLSPARFCSELPASYQWEVSIDGGVYSAIPGATTPTYNPPSGLSSGSYLYRRKATTTASEEAYSNEISVIIDVPQGNENSFGNGEWIAYAYAGADNFSSGNYLGFFTETADFTEDFDAVSVNGCDLPVEDFSVRFKMQQTIAVCDGYDITIGAEGGGARLYVDGVLVIDGYAPVTSLTNYSVNLHLSPGNHQFILEYYNNVGANSLSFSMVATGAAGGGGVIGTDQTACSATYDPIAFTNIEDAEFCSGTVTYSWEQSTTGSFPGTIVGGNSPTLDESTLSPGTYYYRRRATSGGTTVYSNVVVVQVQQPEGDEVTYPNGTWRAYAYQGSTIASATYLGYFDIGSATFDHDFTCAACDVPINGCDLHTEDFSTRFRSSQNMPCGGYDVTIGAEGGGVRLYVNGDLVINGSGANTTYTTYTQNIYLSGPTQFDIEYFNVSGTNRVSFNYTLTNPDGSGGIISGNQDLCMSTLDPAPFTSVSPANFCSGSPTYRWEVLDGSTWIPATPAGTDETYDIPAGLAPGEYSYRRVAIFGAVELASNVVQVSAYTPMGDQTSYGDNAWIGYVYDNEQDWTNDYRGKIDRPTNFDESFCAGFCEFQTDGCPVEASSFSVRFKNSVDFECGSYLITVGGDDGVRLIVDGEIVTEFDKLSPHSYETYSKVMYFDGTPDTELELLYFESGGANRVSFSAVFLGPGNAGTIGGNQYSCNTGIVPGVITNVSEATACASTPITYQWQYSLDGLGWVDIPSATGSSYTPSDPIDVTHYYRRQVTIDGYTWSSNVVTVEVDPPQGDQVTYGQNQWIGYVYEGFQDANPWDPTKYHGYMIRETNFDTPFCGPSCMQPINGCDFLTDNFSIRFLNEMTLACGYYKITIGFNGGGRLYVDENPTPVLSEYWIHDPYETLETTLYFEEGPHKFRYEYREDLHGNRVSFNIEYLGAGTPARIGSMQSICDAPYDPNPINQFVAPVFECNPDATPDYQWQVSVDSVTWTDIPLANSSSYDPPAGHTFTRYYRRKDTNDVGEELFSDVVVIVYNDDPRLHDGSEYGTAPEWIAHVYDGMDNFTDYQGSFIQTMVGDAFDQSFCGPNCVFPIDGCDIVTNTFTVRFRTQINLTEGAYTFTIGSAGAARLTISGGELASPLLAVDHYFIHQPYDTRSNSTPIELQGGTYFLELDYYESFDANRVSFSFTSVPLPVTWSYFNGYYAGGQSFLEWHTASEINNEGFEVEHSADGTNFVKIGWVEGNGNTTIAHQYQFVHNDPKPGWNYYRLKQIDYDGKYEYSRLIPVFADDLPRVEIYPNPLVNERLYLSRVNTDQPVQVTLTNMLGQDPFDLVQDPMQPTCFYLPRRLAPGVYHARIRLGDVVHTRKVIVE